ncbi:MAG: thioredoxin domain-containing protein [Eubacteriales bacterium]|jgi:uncharacterized protein YyaL (SSP411 family)
MSNRMINEKSPYLLQHAENPVDWYPWGEEAKEKALREDKPLFLSIGYSACHWCHVIARESFSDNEVAAVLNRHFVPVKVDREERPDIDSVYMSACQALTGSGGWPLTILALPDGRPFYAATYLPKDSLLKLLRSCALQWEGERTWFYNNANSLTEALREVKNKTAAPGREAEPEKLAAAAYRELSDNFDSRWGGFGSAPKFPTPHNILFLLDYFRDTGEEQALKMANYTLEAMYRGGIYDHIGGGFCRYSTDKMWLVPHFEKMLYDNALLLWAYADAYMLTGRPLFSYAGESTADYVLRELSGADGEFFSSQDADTGGEEGRFYTMTPNEIKAALGEEDGRRFCEWFDITERGNFMGKSIPNLIHNPKFEDEPEEISRLRHTVYEWRRQRATPGLDDKVLTQWNSLMICGLVKGAEAFGRGDYLTAAGRAADYIVKNLRGPDGRLYIRRREGESFGAGIDADYAATALALLLLGRDDEAAALADILLEHFFDHDAGGLYLYADDAEQLFIRPKETYDGAIPSGNSIFLRVLAELFKKTKNEKWRGAYVKQLGFICSAAARYPLACAFALCYKPSVKLLDIRH